MKRFIAATNVNDTVPRFLPTVSGHPKRLRRRYPMRWMLPAKQLAACGRVVPPQNLATEELGYAAVDDETTQQTMRELKNWAIPRSRTLP